MMRKHKKLLWLFLPIAFIPLGIIVSNMPSRCGEKVEVSLGIAGPWKQSQKAALVRLLDELKSCPHSRVIIVWRKQTFFSEINWFGAYYDRQRHQLRDINPETGDNDNWENVSEVAIHQAALLGGNWRLLARFGAKHHYPYG